MYVVEFTRGRDNKELIGRVKMDFGSTSEVIAKASAMVRSGDVAADGYRILDADGQFLAAAWMGTGQ